MSNRENLKLILMLLLPIVLVIGILSLFKVDRQVIESTETKKYIIVGINQPKHFRVDLKDETGRIFQTVAVSKHCNRWREVQLNTVVYLPTSIMKNESGEGKRWIKINARSVCPRN